MRPFRAAAVLAAPAALSIALLGACSDDGDDDALDDAADALDDAAEDVGDAVGEATDDAVEALARNLASAQGADEFGAVDIEVDGDLSCEATVSTDAAEVDIACTGESTEGQELGMVGQTSEIPGASATELEGTFVGTADGEEVFSVDTLGG